MIKKTLLILFVCCIMVFSLAGISDIISSDKIVKDKVIDDAKYKEIKDVFEAKGVDMNNGLDIIWTETNCVDNVSQDVFDENDILISSSEIIGQTCSYELFKENLFNGATISVSYDLNDSVETKQILLEETIQNKIDKTKVVWETRQAKDKVVEIKQEGTTTIISDKTKEIIIK